MASQLIGTTETGWFNPGVNPPPFDMKLLLMVAGSRSEDCGRTFEPYTVVMTAYVQQQWPGAPQRRHRRCRDTRDNPARTPESPASQPAAAHRHRRQAGSIAHGSLRPGRQSFPRPSCPTHASGCLRPSLPTPTIRGRSWFLLSRSECAVLVAENTASPRPAALAVDVFLLVPVHAVRAAS